MSNFLQDIMGLLWKKQRVSPKTDDIIGIGRYLSKEEKVKPKPQITTKVITLEDLKTFVSTEGLVTIKPYTLLAGAGGSSTMPSNYNLIDISWDGLGNGTYVLNLPPASSLPYRNIRIITDGSLDNGAQDKILLTAAPGDTIDGGANFELSKRYEGVSIWSDGTEWIVIQAKAH
jgi:hypothetical protein